MAVGWSMIGKGDKPPFYVLTPAARGQRQQRDQRGRPVGSCGLAFPVLRPACALFSARTV
jgi:hypothetical protein